MFDRLKFEMLIDVPGLAVWRNGGKYYADYVPEILPVEQARQHMMRLRDLVPTDDEFNRLTESLRFTSPS